MELEILKSLEKSESYLRYHLQPKKISFLAESIAVWLTLMDRILYFLYLKILFHITY